jgi:CelD/BcsL family acetyltransferase involved in cellulose biosynthesis
VGIPVAGRLCDFQGVVARQGLAWTAEELVQGSGLSAFHFHAALACQEPFQRCAWAQVSSAYIDLSGGFDAYQMKLRDSGSEEMRKTGQKARKMQREIGPLRFEPHATDQRVLQTLIDWKLQQYRRTKAVNFLAGAWKTTLLENLLHCQGDEFSGMLSALYAGDRLVAAHFGLRSAGVLHGWFPAYDAEFARYSPGQVFWQQLLQAACALGIRRIDLARGEERFKSSLMSGAISVVEGSVDFRRVRKLIRRSWFHTCQWIRSTPLRALARGVARNTRAWLGYSR